MPSITPPYLPRTPRGFALVITITLLALLVLLLVSLAGLTRVETQVADNYKNLEQARQNALAGLNIALGQLQKYAGPDQRVTSTADLAADSAGDTWPSGGTGNPANKVSTNGALAGVQNGTRHWTAVWGANESPSLAYSRTPTPALLTWLVSGNEQNAPEFSVAADGHIATPPAVADFTATPDMAVNLADATPISDVITLGGKPARLLVGGRTAPDSAAYVVAPSVAISAHALGQDGQVPVGHYAWWIGDEGVKARYNLVDTYAGETGTSTAEGRYRATVAQRPAIERIAGLFLYPANDARLPGILDIRQASFSSPAINPSTLRTRFHDISFQSRGLLADTRAGGLRKDLGYYLSAGGLTGKILPSDNAVFTGSVSMKGPSWEILRSFYDLGSGSGAVPLQPASATRHGIAPVVVQVKLFSSFKVGDAVNPYRYYVRLHPVIVLANPYTQPLTGGLDMKVTLSSANGMEFGLKTLSMPAENVFQPRSWLLNLVFRIPDVDLAPGEAKVWYPSSDTTLPASGGVVTMGTDPFHSVGYDTGLDIPAVDAAGDWALRSYYAGEISYAFYASGTTDLVSQVGRVSLSGGVTSTTVTSAMRSGGARGISGFYTALRPLLGRNSGVRPYADYNLRAQSLYRPNVHNAAGQGFFNNPLYVTNNFPATYANGGLDRLMDNLSPAYWGNYLSPATGKTRMVLYDLPRRDSPGESPIISLGQLRHANLTADSIEYSTAFQPANAVGNSLASPYVARDLSSETRTGGGSSAPFYDLSYLLNTALWDGWFFSTIPQSGAFVPGQDRLPNARLVFDLRAPLVAGDVRSGLSPATHLVIEGAFNVNSTSVEAWAAHLSGLRGLSLNGESNLSAPFPRTLRQPQNSTDAGNGVSDQAFAGFRNLTDNDIYNRAAGTGLAVELVREIRKRGPFLSLGHFVNRRLVSSGAPDAAFGLKGALQAALDRSTVNAGFPASDKGTIGTSERIAYSDPDAAEGYMNTGIPGWVTQADILQILGPSLSARSDTFLIRAYGDAVNPATGGIAGRAWCEAVAQRLPDYVVPRNGSSGNAPEDTPTDPANKTFGRRYQIVSFRWLSPEDI